ncbi:m-phase inducer phosphatase [Yamadazyma tenuis]|uniref:m-phase inducer phosphatase n=1 Tax=Candida tenuis TaxID=2315449 RepID=UPI0027A814E4|nr:m-phase inducer phosphatase [Yamadazyma tenuis]
MGNKSLMSPNANIFADKAAKRDRPLSSFLDTPTDHISVFLQKSHQEVDDEGTEEEDDDETHPDTPINNRKNRMVITSPLVSRKPFRNLSNLMNMNIDSVKKRFSSTKRFIKRSKDEDSDSVVHDVDQADRGISVQADLDDLDANTTVSTIDDLEVALDIDDLDDFPKPQAPAPPGLSLRRFHSMYQTTKEKDVVLQDDNSLLKHSNIKYFTVESDLVPRIDSASFCDLINNKYTHQFDEIIVVDCRFDYEYEGGHIKNAINISDKQDLETRFIAQDSEYRSSQRYLIVFHCEFSIFRGPTMASHLRKTDRILNLNNYPHLSYPDILILDGGYKKFYESFKMYCEPQNYVEMKDTNHVKKCSSDLDKFRSFSKLKEHNRSNSYTTITLHSENLKILKRQKSSSFTRPADLQLNRSSTFSYSNELIQQEEFLPPVTKFSRFNGSSNSINSLNSSLSELSTFSSNDSADSVSISNSPILEMNEFFGSSASPTAATTSSSISSLNLGLSQHKKKKSVTAMSSSKTIASDFKFPSLSGFHTSAFSNTQTSSPFNKKNLSISTGVLSTASSSVGSNNTITLSLHNKNTSITSPIISSPLSNMTPTPTPMSTIGTSISHHNRATSIIDPINDTPVDFQVPYYKKSSNGPSQYLDT